MWQEIMSEIAATGLRTRAVSISRLPELMAEIDGLRSDDTVVAEIIPYMKNYRPEDEGQDRMHSILSIATPAKIGQAVFHSGGRTLVAQIPPYYMDFSSTPAAVKTTLNRILNKYGYRATQARMLPCKLMAAHSGLAEYGRNNICYIEGLGSFAFLSVYYTDLPCEEDSWTEARRMALCDHCAQCAKNCPSRAIRTGGSLMPADV